MSQSRKEEATVYASRLAVTLVFDGRYPTSWTAHRYHTSASARCVRTCLPGCWRTLFLKVVVDQLADGVVRCQPCFATRISLVCQRAHSRLFSQRILYGSPLERVPARIYYRVPHYVQSNGASERSWWIAMVLGNQLGSHLRVACTPAHSVYTRRV